MNTAFGLQQQKLDLEATMKTRRGKRSEPFWPSLVMKKWLNIQPKVYEFSEDEIDTETESEDDACSLKDARMPVGEALACSIQRKQPASSQHSASKGYKSRHRRGKSETLRVQYINTKDVRKNSRRRSRHR